MYSIILATYLETDVEFKRIVEKQKNSFNFQGIKQNVILQKENSEYAR